MILKTYFNIADVMNTPASRLLDSIRGVAALLVVVGHCRHYTAIYSNQDSSGSNMLEKLILAPSSFAVEAVGVFFVLSGFLVGGQTIRLNALGKFYWRPFLIKRLSRLWTVLFPGVLLTWVLWYLAGYISPEIIPSKSVETTDLFTGICNLLFFQESWCKPFSINDSLWSLSYEFWFYVVFASSCATIFSISRGYLINTLVNISITFGSVLLFGIDLLYLFPAWILGALMGWVFERPNYMRRMVGSRPYLWFTVSIFFLAISFVISNVYRLDRVSLILLVAIPSSLVILSAALVVNEPTILRRCINFGAWFGHRSFSIYVFHLPIIFVFLSISSSFGLIEKISLPVATYGLLLLTLPLTCLMWWLTERHTNTVRAIMLKYL